MLLKSSVRSSAFSGEAASHSTPTRPTDRLRRWAFLEWPETRPWARALNMALFVLAVLWTQSSSQGFLPTVALSFAVSPMVGQNFGGRKAERVRHSIYSGIGLAIALMLVLAVITWSAPGAMIRFFSKDPQVIAFGRDYLTIVAFNFVAAGVVFTSSSVFQGLGNTMPPLLSSELMVKGF